MQIMKDSKTENEFFKRASMQLAAGGIAAMVDLCLMQPLDVVKTRLQLVPAGFEVHYDGFSDCFIKMYKTEGFLAFWKGTLPLLLSQTPRIALKFVCFEEIKSLFLFGSPEPTPLTYSMAGFVVGIADGILINPFEVVKVTQQADHHSMKETPGAWAITKRIIKTEGLGLSGINKGLTATMARQIVFNVFYFGFYHSVKTIMPAYENSRKEFWRKVLIGFMAGTLASFGNIPFDVAKSRIQGPQPEPGKVKYRTTFRSMIMVTREEGIGALFKGLLPKIVRLGSGGAITLLLFEHAYEYLRESFQ